MTRIKNLIKKTTSCLFLAAVWLVACTASAAPATTPIPPSATKTNTPAPTITSTPIPTQTTTPIHTVTPTATPTPLPTFTPTPDIWEIQKCHKAPSVIDPSSAFIWIYTGDLEGQGQIDMLLNFTESNEIQGFAFDFEQVREYQVSGCVEQRSFTMWLQQNGVVVAMIQGEFPEIDPRDHYSGALSFDVITGLLAEKGNSENHSLYLHLSSGQGGTMERRFHLEGVQDDQIILNASQQFLSAIVQDDRQQVVELLQFPIEVFFKGERKVLPTPEDFLLYYNAIFGDGFKERLAITFPNYILAQGGNWGGIYLYVYGGGSIGFDMQGKVFAIYNREDPTPTAVASSTPKP
jgi:hypothetical protein